MRKSLSSRISGIFLICAIALTITGGLLTNNVAFAAQADASNIRLLDTDFNGIIDRMIFDIDNPSTTTWSFYGPAPYGLSATENSSSLPITAVSFSGASNGTATVTINVDLDETGRSIDTDCVITNPIDLIYTQGNGGAACAGAQGCIQDSTNEISTILSGDTGGNNVELDWAFPVIDTFEYQDSDNDGMIDQFELFYSEMVVAASVLSADDLNLTNVGDFAGASFGTINTDLIAGTIMSSVVPLGTEATVIDTSEDSGTIAISTQKAFSLQDSTGNTNMNLVAQTQASFNDGAEPIITDFWYYSDGNNGSVDRADVEFSENVTWNGLEPNMFGFYSNNLTGFSTITNEATSFTGSGTDTFTFVMPGTTDLTGVSSNFPELDYVGTGSATPANNVKDVTGNDAAFIMAPTVIRDEAEPILLTAETVSHNDIELVFSEAISATGLAGGDIFLSSPGNYAMDSVTGGGTDTITWTTATASEYWNTDATGSSAGTGTDETGTVQTNIPNITFNAGVFTDTASPANGVIPVTASTMTTDGASPFPIFFEYWGAGDHVDAIAVDFSETIATNDAVLGDFTYVANDITNSLITGGTYNAETADVTVTIDLGTNGDSGITSHSSAPTLAYVDGGGTEISDAAGNQVDTFTAQSLEDGADPALLACEYENLSGGIGDGTVDSIYMQFTEDIDDDIGGMVSADFSVTINGSTIGAAEMGETLNVGTADDDEIDIAFTNGLTFNTHDDYEISVGGGLIGDASGNYLPALTFSACADAAAPVFTSVDPPTGSYENDSDVSYTLSEALGGGQITWTWQSGPGTTQNSTLTGAELTAGAHTDITLINAPALVDGTVYTVSFDGGDSNGNLATQVNSTGVTYDTTDPTPTISVDTASIYEGDLTQQVTIKYDEPMDNTSTPTVSFTSSGNWTIVPGGAWSTDTLTDDTYTVNFTHDGTAENTLPETITVGAVSGANDLAYNDDTADSTTFGVDTIDPIPTLTSIMPLYTSGATTMTFNTSDAGGSGVNTTMCSVDDSTFTPCTTGDAISTLGGWGPKLDGPFTITLRITDNAGNTADATDSVSSKDTTVPVTTMGPTPTSTNGTQTIAFTASDATSGVASTECSVNGATFATATSGVTTYANCGGWAGLAEGAFTLTVRTTDGVGLTHDDTASVIKDTTAPLAPAAPDMTAGTDTGISNSDDLTYNTSPAFYIANIETNATVSLISSVDSGVGPGVEVGNATTITPVMPMTGGVGTAHSMTATQTDVAGNTSLASAPLGIIIDTTDPTVVETTAVDDPTNDQTPNLSFSSDEAGAISWAAVCNSATTSATAATQTITLDVDGAGGDLAEGTYNCTLTVTDNAGNASLALALSTFEIDVTAPTGTATAGTALYEGDLVQEVTVDYDDDMAGVSIPTITFTGATGTFTSNADGTWTDADTWTETFTITDADEETGGVTVHSSAATDEAGNTEGAPVSDTFDVDTLAPTLTAVTIASDNATDTTKAVVGDDITLTIASSELINQPVVAYTSGAAAVADTPSTYFPAWTAAYTVDLADTEGLVEYTIDFSDLAGNNGTQVTATTDASSVAFDVSAPVVLTYSPADDATGAAISGNLVLTFDENVVVGTGDVVIYKSADDSILETVDITTANVTFDGTTGVTINPTANMTYSTAYYVQIDATAIENTVALPYTGIADKTTWNFTTGAAPVPSSSGGGSAGGIRRVTTPVEETVEEPLVFADVVEHWAEEFIFEAQQDGYVEGYEDATFKPDNYITRAEASKLVAMWLDANIGEDACTADLFSDVVCVDWYAKYVTYLSDAGIVEGYEGGIFGPGNYITRAEALKIMLFAKAIQDDSILDVINPFSDVNGEQWFYNYVMVGYKLSIVQGYEDGTFGPERNVTRAEFTKIFVETLINN